jgi:hypothetical protein
MKSRIYIERILGVGFIGLLMASCSSSDNDGIGSSNPIVFTTQYSTSRADNGEITNMPSGTKFAIRMYYDTRVTSTLSDLQFTTMESSAMTVGTDGACSYNTADNFENFYWNNRKFHGFIAYTELAKNVTTLDGDNVTVDIADQRDPLLAVTQKQPANGDNSANKVTLLFEHQLSKVQVNIKSDGVSVGDNEVTISSILLKGLAKQAIIYTTFPENVATIEHQATAASAETIDLSMPLSTTPETGYLKSAQCIAFGGITAIQVEWYETADDGTKTNHTATYTFGTDTTEASPTLVGGKSYIYNLTVTRGLIASINSTITDWVSDGDSHTANGTK